MYQEAVAAGTDLRDYYVKLMPYNQTHNYIA